MHHPISRRTALRAAGVAISIPLLESMGSATGRPTEPPPQRMVFICNTLGLHPPSLFPKRAGADYEATEYLELLQDHRDDFTLISGLSHPDQSGKQPHDTEMTWLTSARNPGLGGFKNSVSIDQFAAAKLGHVTRFPSLALSTNTQKSQSYTSNGVMLPAYDRPSQIFASLFLQGNEQELGKVRNQLNDGKSILDSVAEQTRSLERQASAKDRRQLDAYYSAIREAEAELTIAESWLDRPKPVVDAEPPSDIPDPADLIGRTQTLLNLIPLILQTDSSRIISLVIQDPMAVPKIDGVSAEHHNLSHHGQDPKKIAQLKKIETEILTSFSNFLTKMAETSETQNRLLDQTSILFGSNLGNANAHDPRNLPIIVAGGGNSHGKYVAHDRNKNTPLCNLFVRLLNNTGIEVDSFGTSSGTLEL